ncbi:MAG: hypothetical protein EHM14_06725 [Methanothrix sp.]|jgi:hypothetical protein|nr:MAG: hypothetical protein EHM14_06725 [Methanothrix sp.]
MNEKELSEISPQHSLWPLVADDAVDKAMDILIPQAEKLIEDLFRYPHQMERHQITNLVSVSLETNSVPLVLDYIRYQIGRDNRNTSWRIGQPSFGTKLLEQFEGLRQRAGGLMEKAIKEYGIEPQNKNDEEARIWMQLVRHFVGSLHHNFVYYETEKMKRKGSRP